MSTGRITRILLSEAASRALDASGEKVFAIVHRVMRPEEPEANGRWCIHLAPLDWDKARAAAGVLAGTHKATRIKASKANVTTTRAREAVPREGAES